MQQAQEVAREVAEKFKEIFEDELISVILFGSAAGGLYKPGKSDINLLIVLTEIGINKLGDIPPILEEFRKKNLSTPLLITEEFIRTSLDTFPVEFLNMQVMYQLISGKDVLKDLIFEKKWLRAQCERELKGKLLYLRQGFIETGGKKKALLTLISQSLRTFFFLFNGLLFLCDREIPESRLEKLEILADKFQLDKKLFKHLLEIYETGQSSGDEALIETTLKYVAEMTKLSREVDRLSETW